MDKTTLKSQGNTVFGFSMLLGGIALLLTVAMLGFGTQSAFANGANGPVAQGTQPIPQVTPTNTAVATVGSTVTAQVTVTTVTTGTVVATGTVVPTTTAEVTPVGTVVATGTVEATTTVAGTAVATATSEATVAATSTSIPVATSEVLPTEGTGMIETATPISVGMPRTGSPVGGASSGLTLTLLLIGVMMTTIGLASLAARKNSYKR